MIILSENAISVIRNSCLTNNGRCILISIRKEWLDKILSTDLSVIKSIELRKSCPATDLPVDIVFYETQSGNGLGMIKAIGTVDDFVRYDNYCKDILNLARIDRVTYDMYAYGHHTWGWKLGNVRTFINPISLTDIGIKRPPQSWRYIYI